MIAMNATTGVKNRAPLGFWLLSGALVLYVAACTGFRDQKWGADAWEHHRAVLALTQDLRHPGNPTYASDIPSVRYSPYTVGLAVLCRTTGIDPYNALSFAAVLNTALLCLGVWLLLRSYGEAASAGAVLLVMVSLYGGAPAYANSYALADLPWHQVNPSAFSFGLTLLSWSLLRRVLSGRGGLAAWAGIAVLMSCAMLDHPMTGAFGMLGLAVLVATGANEDRLRGATGLAIVAAVVAALALAWPWYSFLAAVRWHGDNDYWFNPGILVMMLTQWCAPAMLCALFAIPLRRQPLVRTCLVGGSACMAVGLAAWLVRSPALARFPLPGLIFFHIAVGIWAHNTGLLRLSTWPARLHAIFSPGLDSTATALLQTTVALFIGYFLVPQLLMVAIEPHLARAYVARALHHRNLQEHLRDELSVLMKDVGPRDVVLSDLETSWLIPSSRGRIVAAMHYELFVPDQAQRAADLAEFFSTDAEQARKQILKKYGVRWILLDRKQIDPQTFATLLREPAVVAQDEDMVLMRTDTWIAAGPKLHAALPAGATASAHDHRTM